MKCTRACKGCKGETCTNASDIVDNTNDGDEDENENFPAYRKIIQAIHGSDLDR